MTICVLHCPQQSRFSHLLPYKVLKVQRPATPLPFFVLQKIRTVSATKPPVQDFDTFQRSQLNHCEQSKTEQEPILFRAFEGRKMKRCYQFTSGLCNTQRGLIICTPRGKVTVF